MFTMAVPRDKYVEMNWRAADKVEARKQFKHCMNMILMADNTPKERQYASRG